MDAVLDHEPELGVQRRCNSCGEWWPLDNDFWRYQPRRAGTAVSRGRVYTRRATGCWMQPCRACHNAAVRRAGRAGRGHAA